MVDMVTTWKNDFGRILVVVLDPAPIPAKRDVVIGDHYFSLEIEKERVGLDENGDGVELDFDGSGDGGEEQEDEDEPDRGSKRAKPADLGLELNIPKIS
jgi:hypothetical protein